METSAPVKQENKIGTPQKTLKDLTPIEQQQFITQAIVEKDKFVSWAQKLAEEDSVKPPSTIVSRISESWKHAPSKKMLIAALSAVGISNIGITIAGKRAGISNYDIGVLWYSTFGAPVLEELVFRSKKIPKFIESTGKKLGISIQPNTARLATSGMFLGIHADQLFFNPVAALPIFTTGVTMQKLAHERGMSASIACHSLLNALTFSMMYGAEGPLSSYIFGERDQGLLKGVIKKDSTMGMVKNLFLLTNLGMQVGVGILGVRELIKDKQINDLLSRYRHGGEGSKSLIDFDKTNEITHELLAFPSTDGYKFQAGVELAYVNAALQMPDVLKDQMNPDDYARSQVHKMVTSSWKDAKTLPHRLEKANTYITEQIAKRTKI